MEVDVNVLDGKLNALLDGHSENPISSPSSLASTSSEAFQHYSALYREPLTKDEQALQIERSERLLTQFWGDESTRRTRTEKDKQELEALIDLAMLGWGLCETYEGEVSKAAKHRLAEDLSRYNSGEGCTAWTENDQRALEYQRQNEDYIQLADKLSVFLTGDESSENEKVLRYRLRNIKALLRFYNFQWQDSQGRMQEYVKRRRQRVTDLAEIGANDCESEKQGICDSSLDGSEQKDPTGVKTYVGPVKSLTAPKAVQQKRAILRRPSNVPRNLPFSSPSLPSGADIAESQHSPKNVHMRQSRQLQPLAPDIAKGQVMTVYKGPRKRAIQSKRKEKVESKTIPRNYTKPQGVSKMKPARGKSRKK